MAGTALASFFSPRRKVETQIEITASPERVWKVLTDTAAYPSWNPFIRTLTGHLRTGQRLTVKLNGQERNGDMVFNPKVIGVNPGQYLQWIGKIWGLPGLFTGVHDFEIIPTNHGTVFRQSETFSGMFLWFYDVERVRSDFEKMNYAVKKRAESS
uniref:SRPBCC domain-containing protein n=1 Tax=Gluconobacter thailandicus TaxID=257438 RepID=UPI0018D4A0CB|nr:SRPBCC domain-containing protein [Gluconobacter thailandicus]